MSALTEYAVSSVDPEPEDVPGIPEGLAEDHRPLTDFEMRDMYRKTCEIHDAMMKLKQTADELPAKLPQIMESMPPMVRMALGGFLK